MQAGILKEQSHKNALGDGLSGAGGLALAKWLGGRFTWRAGTLTEKSHESNT
jgi:hypothetical protein